MVLSMPDDTLGVCGLCPQLQRSRRALAASFCVERLQYFWFSRWSRPTGASALTRREPLSNDRCPRTRSANAVVSHREPWLGLAG